MWIFNSTVTGRLKTYHFRIGNVKIAEIRFRKKKGSWVAYLGLLDIAGNLEFTEFQTMSDALKKLHKKLNQPGEPE